MQDAKTRSLGLQRFIGSVHEVLDGRAGPGGQVPAKSDVFALLRPLFEEALEEPDLLAAGVASASALPPSGVAKYLLHRSPEFVLFSTVLAPHAALPAHDHGGWGMVGLYQGVEEEVRYAQLDPVGSDGGLVGLAELSRVVHTKGSTTTIRPPVPDIHQVVNRSDEPSVTVHLFGHDPVTSGFRMYAPVFRIIDTGPLGFDEVPEA